MPIPVPSANPAGRWTTNFRSPSPCSDQSGEEGDEDAGRVDGGRQSTFDEKLRSELDMSSREDHAAKFKHNPFTIAKMTGASLSKRPVKTKDLKESSQNHISRGAGLSKKETPRVPMGQSVLVTDSFKSTKSTIGNRNKIISAQLRIQKEKSQLLQPSSKPDNVPRPKSKSSAPVQFGKLPTNASSRSSEFPIISALKKQELLPVRPRPTPRPLGREGNKKGEVVGKAPMGLGVLRMADEFDVRGEEMMEAGAVVLVNDSMMRGMTRSLSIENTTGETTNDGSSPTRPPISLNHSSHQTPPLFRPISTYNPPSLTRHSPVEPSRVGNDLMRYRKGDEEHALIWDNGDGDSIPQGMEDQPMSHPPERLVPRRISKPMDINISPPQKRSPPPSFWIKSQNRNIDRKKTYEETARVKAKAAKENRAVHGIEVGTVMGVVEEDLFKYERMERIGIRDRPRRDLKPRSQADFYNDDVSARSKSSSDVEWTTIPSPKRSIPLRHGTSVPTRRSALFRLPGKMLFDLPVEKDKDLPRKVLNSKRKGGDQITVIPLKRKMTLFTPTPTGVSKTELEIEGRRSSDGQATEEEEVFAIDQVISQAHDQQVPDRGGRAFGSDSATEVESRRRKLEPPAEAVKDPFEMTTSPITSLFEMVLQADYVNPCDAPPSSPGHRRMIFDIDLIRKRYPATRANVDESARVKISDHLDDDNDDGEKVAKGDMLRRGRFRRSGRVA